MRMIEISKKDAINIGKQSEADVRSQPVSSSASDEVLLAAHGRTFHFAARFLPAKHRQQFTTLYAFFRTLDDLVDEPSTSRCSEDIQAELHTWRRWFSEQYAFSAPRPALGERLTTILNEHAIPTGIFLDFLDGLASDLEPCEMQDFRELHRYCYRVAGTVGLALTHVLDTHSPQALGAAQSLGIAMQLTNILRDVGSDLAAGRIYIPQEDLQRFGSSRAHLLHLLKEQRGPDDRFRALLRFQIERAHRYYAHGMSGIWLLPPDCRLPILVASRLYRRILNVIERRNYDVLRARAATSFPEKVREASIAYMLEHLWRRGEFLPDLETEVFIEG